MQTFIVSPDRFAVAAIDSSLARSDGRAIGPEHFRRTAFESAGRGRGEPAGDEPDAERHLEQSTGDGADEPGARDAEQHQECARGEARVADETPASQETWNESGAEEQGAEEEASDAEPGFGDVVEDGVRIDRGGAGDDDENHDTDGQNNALEDPRTHVA